MMSGKQKRIAIKAHRVAKRAKVARSARQMPLTPYWQPKGTVLVDRWRLAPSNSYGEPKFVTRGYYEDLSFTCRDCGAKQVWTAEQQQWWYETAKGYVYSTAVRCLTCRRARRMAGGGNTLNALKATK